MPSYDYDSGGYGRTLADLMRRRGDQAATRHLQQGDIAANLWGQAGQTIANSVAGWQRNVQANREYELESARESRRAEAEGIQIQAAKMQLGESQRKQKGEATARALLPFARHENGVMGYDRELIQREMESAGHGDMVPQLFAQFDEQETSYLKVLEARRDTIAQDAFRVLQGGSADEETFDAMLTLWSENDLAPKVEIDALRKAAKKSGVQQALLAAASSSPRVADQIRKMQESNRPDLASFPPENTIVDKRSGEVVQQGSQKPPTNIEDAILRAMQDGNQGEVDRLVGIKERVARAGRAPAASEPLVAIIDDKGNPVLVPRSEAVGRPPASTREQGRQVTSGDAGEIAEFNTALDDVSMLRETLSGNKATGASAQVGAALPNVVTEMFGWGEDAKKKQAVIDRVKQVIGKALEGGVLRKEDERKYAKILPTIGDDPNVVTAKLQGLESAIQQRQQRKVEALSDAGYDVSKFAARESGDGASTVKMRAPDGSVQDVDRSLVDHYKSLGATVVP